MKLLTFDHAGFPAAAIVNDAGDAILPIRTQRADAPGCRPTSMRELLQSWGSWPGQLARLRREATPDAWLPVSEVRVLAPLPQPHSLTCIGLNYRDHASETGAATPTEPVVFAKHVSTVIGSGDPIILPKASEEVDYEAELGVVIGAEAFRVPPQEALKVVAGYTIVNDVSARDVQSRTSQWMVAKSFPSFCPMGPVLVTADEFGNGSGRHVGLSVNGRTLQASSTDEMIFTVAEIVSYLSQVWPLMPGDMIATGTPAGVGFTRTPPVFLCDGDVVEVSISGIGVLTNHVKAAAS